MSVPPDRSPPPLTSTTTPFAKLALAHAASVGGDVFVTVALADSVFFSVEPGAARGKVLLYLLFTVAPFAVIAPVLGPALDRTRGGRRLVMVLSCAGRAVLALLMARNIDSLLLYPLAFCFLVLARGQQIAKSAIVPHVIDDERELVRANSRLALIGVLAGLAGGLPAAAILKLAGGDWALRVAFVVFVGAALLVLGVPKAGVVAPPETLEQRHLLHAQSIRLAGTAMSLVRFVVGFMTFFAAFLLKSNHEPAWMFGVVLLASGLGNGFGTIVAPLLRRRFREEWILAGSMLLPAVPLLFAARAYGRTALAFAAFAVAACAATARLAFDTILQRDAAEAARGRAFARFETRFQIVWVGGGLLAAVFPSWGKAGVFLAALILGFAGLTYAGTFRRPAPPRAEPAPPVGS